MWFDLKGDSRLGRCTTEGCGGQPTSRLEHGGVGSDYCSGCRENITKFLARAALDRIDHETRVNLGLIGVGQSTQPEK